jgi:uncharacterized membrane protein
MYDWIIIILLFILSILLSIYWVENMPNSEDKDGGKRQEANKKPNR